ncbi:hypothetical protein Tsubulata_013845 [Turnera subulata]|uniref:Prolamin-like domain-containing protein n=1 Tax=Turnera subulata TaxID=218843 RepID=A0A9Q0G5X8_9ROSI|nr:hypothetical protein Tsubulata_013845 [Turnera subulata]
MKTVIVSLLLFLVLGQCLAHPRLQADSKPPQGSPSSPKHAPPRPKLPPLASDPKVQKCVKSFKAEEKCLGDIMKSYFSRRLTIDANCCQSLLAVKKDCLPIIFYRFNSMFFPRLLQKHCAAPPPSA